MSSYLNFIFLLSNFIFLIIFVLSKHFVTASVYALTKPPAPNLVPPKYLTTIANMLSNFLFSSTFKIGNPAV